MRGVEWLGEFWVTLGKNFANYRGKFSVVKFRVFVTHLQLTFSIEKK